MDGAAVTQPPVVGLPPNTAFGGGGGRVAADNDQSSSALNSFRVSSVIERLFRHVQGFEKSDAVVFVNLCLSLARGIDFAIANNAVPSKSNELPSLMKLICQDGNDTLLQAAIMVLLISVKSACQNGWFSDKDSEELNYLAKEVASTFGHVSDFKTVPSLSLSVISTIMSRFYPQMRMGQIFAFIEAKPGFEAYVSDFQISKNVNPSLGEKIRLFVAQTDNIETSSCLISPAKVNFLLNGKGVDRRTNLFMDTGPQIPTIVTHFLKYGSNLLQAVGEFNGNYIVAVAFMSEISSLNSSTLQDYEQSATAAVDSDSEIIEGPSRISLNCPISRQRIKTPVKGCSCNHIQCFDFNNYVEINSRRPSWRCPSCNQHVCFTDVCIDRKMVKVLQEAEPNVTDIIISSDGSWNTVMEIDDAVEKPEGDETIVGEDESAERADVLDLTEIEDAMDATNTNGTEDMKNADQFQFMSQNHTADRNDFNNQSSTQVLNGFSSGIYMPTNGPPNAQNPTSLPNTLQLQQHQLGNPSINNEYGRFPSMMPQHVSQTPTAVQALPVPTQNPVPQRRPRNFIPNTFSAASQASPTAPVTSTALPLQTPSPVVQQSSRNNMNGFIPNHFSASSQAPRAALGMPTTFRAPSSIPRLQQSSIHVRNSFMASSFAAASQASPAAQRIDLAHGANPCHISQVSASPSLQPHHARQNPYPQAQPHQQNPFPLARPHQQQNAGFHHRNLVQNAHQFSNERRSPSQQAANFSPIRPRSQQFPGQVPSSVQASRNSLPPQGQAHMIAAANMAAQMAVDSSRAPPSFSWNPNISNMPLPGDQMDNIGVASQPVTGTDAFDSNDFNWRPSVRMRGALSGQAYADALNQFIIRPTQQAQATRPTLNMSSMPVNVASQLQAMMSAGVAQGTPASNNYPSAAPGFGLDSSGIS